MSTPVLGWWVQNWLNEPNGLVIVVCWAFWVIFSICLHELGHGWAAIRHGDQTPIHTGHMTWNPLVHMGPTSLIMFALVGIAWGAMPVDPSRMRGRHAEAVVAAAGPAVNLVLAAACLVGLAVWVEHVAPALSNQTLAENMEIFLLFGGMLNVALLLFNLLPVPPLDGFRILSHYVPAAGRPFEGEHGQWVGFGLFVLVFMFAGRVVFGVAMDVTLSVVGVLRGVI